MMYKSFLNNQDRCSRHYKKDEENEILSSFTQYAWKANNLHTFPVMPMIDTLQEKNEKAQNFIVFCQYVWRANKVKTFPKTSRTDIRSNKRKA